MKFVADMRNLGPKSAALLANVDICLADDLIEIGPIEAYKKVKAKYPDQVNLNMLWALYGAISNKEWSAISEEEKIRLKEYL